MAEFENLGIDLSFKTDTDLSAKQYYLVKSDTDADTVVISTAHAAAIGVLQNDPTSGVEAQVRCRSGVKTKVIAGASITVGQTLESDSTGRAVAFTYDSDGGTDCYMVGIALSAYSNADEYITMLTYFAPSAQ